MLLVSAKVGPFKSIDSPQTVDIDPKVTVLVGMNEAGKTAFLQALQKTRDVLGLEEFRPIDDYPRKNLTSYQKRHETKPDVATVLTPGGHFKILHPWPGQNPPLDRGGAG